MDGVWQAVDSILRPSLSRWREQEQGVGWFPGSVSLGCFGASLPYWN